MTVSIQLTDKEQKLVKAYAQNHSMSLEEAFKQALFKRIEDEYDLIMAEEAYGEYKASGCGSTPVADFWRELDEDERS